LQKGDVLLYELPGVFERYVGPIVRTGVVGKPDAEFERQCRANIETTNAVIEAMKPGAVAADIQQICNDSFARYGYGDLHGFRSAYSIGLNYAPDWGEGHIFSVVEGEHRPLQPNMTFHVIPGLRVTGKYSLMFSDSVLITTTGAERLTHAPQELFVR
jgi:Xaa-Pro dipeptidase